MKTKIVALILAAVSCIALSSCGKSVTETLVDQSENMLQEMQKSAKDKQTSKEQLLENNKMAVNDVVLNFSSADYVIKAYSIISEEIFSGETSDSLYLYIDYTNNHTEDSSYSSLGSECKAYQNGIQLSSAGYMHNDNYVKVQPGTTIEVVEALKLRDNESDVQLKFTYMNEDYKTETAECVLKIK